MPHRCRLRGRRQNQQQGEREQRTHRRAIGEHPETWSISERRPPAGLPVDRRCRSLRGRLARPHASVTGWSCPGWPERGRARLDHLPALAVGRHRLLFASLAVETARSSAARRPAGVPAWLFLALPARAFLVQVHVERAAAPCSFSSTRWPSRRAAGLALQLLFGIAGAAGRAPADARHRGRRRWIGRWERRHPARAPI